MASTPEPSLWLIKISDVARWMSTIWWVTKRPELYPIPANASIIHQFLPSNLMYGLKSSKLKRGVCGFFAILRENKEALHVMNKAIFSTLFATTILWTMPFASAGQNSYFSND